jgi:MFS family permease
MIRKIRESKLDVTSRALNVVTPTRSWSLGKKWRATIIVSAFNLIGPISSTMIAPASGQLAEHFDIHSTVLLAMTTSIFVLSYGGNFVVLTADSIRSLQFFAVIIAFGPLFLGPLSEIYGRSHVLQISNLWFLGKFCLSS